VKIDNAEVVASLAKERRAYRNALIGMNRSSWYFVGNTPCFGETVHADIPADIARPYLAAHLREIEDKLVALGVDLERTAVE
jgi:hypothetical protein